MTNQEIIFIDSYTSIISVTLWLKTITYQAQFTLTTSITITANTITTPTTIVITIITTNATTETGNKG